MSESSGQPRPSEVTSELGFFDRFAGRASDIVSRAPFFALCLGLVGVWLLEGVARVVSGGWEGFLDDSYQLQINTTTTIITFLLVALLQNTQTRSDRALHHKLDTIADGLADLMEHVADRDDDDDLRGDIVELKAAIGLELREGSKDA
ncbi:MAG TPA: low affinity iron permease family protein [Actinomycetota bacterium]|jgi:low affinity Fe/Cu permease